MVTGPVLMQIIQAERPWRVPGDRLGAHAANAAPHCSLAPFTGRSLGTSITA